MNSDNTEPKKNKYSEAQKKAYKKYLEKNKDNINKKQRERNKLKKERPDHKDKIKKYIETHKQKIKDGTVKKHPPNPTAAFLIAEKQNLKFMNKILNNITKQKNALEQAQQNNPLINNKEKIDESSNILNMLLQNMNSNFKNDIKLLENRADALEYKTSQPIKYLLTDEQNALYNTTIKANEEKQRDAPFNTPGIFDPNQWQQSGENNSSNFPIIPYNENNSNDDEFFDAIEIQPQLKTANDYINEGLFKGPKITRRTTETPDEEFEDDEPQPTQQPKPIFY